MSKINLATLLNQNSFVFFFLVVDKFLDIDIPELINFKKIYLSDYHSIKLKNSGALLSNPDVIQYIKDNSKSKIPVIVPFKPSAKIDFLCQKYGWLKASNDGQINRFLEDKIKFALLCKKYNLPTIPQTVDKFNQKNFSKYQKMYGQNLVIQTHFGWAGNSTYSSSSWNQISDKISPDVIVKYSPLINGSYSLLNNCCLTKFGLIQSSPALQYTGLKKLTSNPFTTVGRQWPSFAPIEIINQVKQITDDFSKVLEEINYRGFFGLDFLVKDNQVFLLECNPRLTASFAFYTKLELIQKITPLFYFHLAEFIKLDYSIDIKSEQKRFNLDIVGSEITAKNKYQQTIKKLNFLKPIFENTNLTNPSLDLSNLPHEKV